ncbi:MAG: type II toxin-antitoxin system VapC family toxin [Chloroflexi bacterium]|nr:type II toxin-antitoxin system VapC family toxin [Chloroflexota bacterium]
MGYLLDTHAFLWWIDDDPRVSQRVREILATPEEEVFFSAISAWEIAIKVQLGRLQFRGEPREFVPAQVRVNRFISLPVEVRHALGVSHLPLLHRDPFDRLLIAQAQVENLAILTGDPAIARYDVAIVWH